MWNEGLGGSVNGSGGGCVAAGRDVCGGARVHVCFSVCICGVRFCVHASVLLSVCSSGCVLRSCVIVRIHVCTCGPAALGRVHKSHQDLSRGQDSTPCPPNSQRWRLDFSLRPKHVSYRMEKANCPANSCSLSHGSRGPWRKSPAPDVQKYPPAASTSESVSA